MGVEFGDTIYGVVPDGASDLTAIQGDGETVTAPVNGTVYTLAAGQYTATFKTSAGARTFGINK